MKTEVYTTTHPRLQGCFHYQFGNLLIIADNEEVFEELSGPIEELTFGWHRAYADFLKEIMGRANEKIGFSSFPPAKLVVTKDSETFKELYHAPKRWHMLPAWVRVSGYVNQSLGAYICFFNPDTIGIAPINVEDTSHEFIHIILPELLRIPHVNIRKIWPTWINEAFAVGLAQRQSIEWIQTELKNPIIRKPTISSIIQNGIFTHDIRSPKTNVAYQYCVIAAEKLGIQLIPHVRRRVNIPPTYNLRPLEAVLDMTGLAHRNNLSLMDEVNLLGISLEEIDRDIYCDLGVALA